jgi:hypothetical protein
MLMDHIGHQSSTPLPILTRSQPQDHHQQLAFVLPAVVHRKPPQQRLLPIRLALLVPFAKNQLNVLLVKSLIVLLALFAHRQPHRNQPSLSRVTLVEPSVALVSFPFVCLLLFGFNPSLNSL